MIDVLSPFRLVIIRREASMELVKIAVYSIGAAAVATLILGAAMRGLRAFQMRDQSFELRPAGSAGSTNAKSKFRPKP
jgi:hypothetical protein